MHFVAEHAGQKLIRRETQVFSQATGEKTQTLPAIWLHLERGKAPDWAASAAAERFTFATRPVAGSIGGVDVPVSQWCVYVDTVQWAQEKGYGDDLREAADAVLGGSADMLRVEPPPLRPPWPNYDELQPQGQRSAAKVAAQNLEMAAAIGVPVDELLVYERATRNQPEVVLVYEAQLAASAPAEEEDAEVVVPA